MKTKSKREKVDKIVYSLQPKTVTLEIRRSDWDKDHILFLLDGKDVFSLYSEHLKAISDWANK